MTTAVTTGQGGALANAGVANPFAAAGRDAGNTIFVKFKGSNGDFLAGQDEDEIAHGTCFAGDVMNAKFSWAFWWDGEVLETLDYHVVESPTAYDNEPDHLPKDYDGDMSLEEIREMQADRSNTFMDGWTCQGVVNLRGIDGDTEEYTLKLNAGVALKAFRAMLSSFGRVFMQKPGQLPIIELDARSYKSKNKTVGTRYAPKLTIVDWRTEEELAGGGDDPSDYDDDADENVGNTEAPALESPKGEASSEAKLASRRGRRGRGNVGG